jgi:hypothetical protein
MLLNFQHPHVHRFDDGSSIFETPAFKLEDVRGMDERQAAFV